MKRTYVNLDNENELLFPLFASSNKKMMLPYMLDLHKYSQEECEFCDELFFCGYDLLVHNAKHITIPLKREMVQCTQCNLYFASATELDIHTKIHHFEVSNILESIITSKPIVKCDNSVTELLMNDNKKKLGKILNKQAVVQCDTSVNDLLLQNSERKLDKILNKKAVVECDSTLTDLISKTEDKLKNFVCKQPVIRCEDTIKSLFMTTNKTDCEVFNNKTNIINGMPKIILKKQDLIRVVKDTTQEVIKANQLNECKSVTKEIDINDIFKPVKENQKTPRNSNSGDCVFGNDTNKIKSRLIFEDEASEFDDDIITVEKDIEICDLTLDDSDEDLAEHANNSGEKILNGLNSKEDTVEATIQEEHITPSIHYEDLIEPSSLTCNKCGLSFSDRYNLILHETESHLSFKPQHIAQKTRVCCLCDMYIVGNHWTMRRHIEEKHPFCSTKVYFKLKRCPKCHLKYYIYTRHSMNYHFIYTCLVCSKVFEIESEYTEHVQNCSPNPNGPSHNQERIAMEKLIKICETCLSFKKNTQTYKYVTLRDYSEKGRRVTCELCEKQFFEVKLVKLINTHPIVQPFYHRKVNNVKPVTNETRLKNIQKRLKIMSKRC